jgi:hypothetical protein
MLGFLAISTMADEASSLSNSEGTEVPSSDKAEGILIDHVWAGHPVSFGLLTERGHQFVAYYDADRKITVAGRSLEQSTWTKVQPEGVWSEGRKRMSNVTGWDSHNYLTMALDRDGCLHLAGNVHGDPLIYYRTEKSFDLTTLKRIDTMTGEREDRTTYPIFSTTTNGDLIFKYRDGGSGNGSDLYNIYDADTRTWKRLFDGPLLDGEGARSAYGTGPRPGPDGRYHMLWMWRDTPNAESNHTLSYARSEDLIHWQDSKGEPIARPIRIANGEVVDDAKPNSGLINMTYALGWDREHRPVAVYHRYDQQRRSQIYVARSDGKGNWQRNQLSDWDFRWEFPGNGSQAKQVSVKPPVAQADGNLLVEFSTRQAGSGTWVLDQQSLAVLAQLPAEAKQASQFSSRPQGDFPGLQVKTQSAHDRGLRWTLRWETLGVNRDMENREVPPPSELWLFAEKDQG